MNTTVDVIGLGGAGGFLASSLYRGGLRPRIITRGATLQRLHEVGLTILSDNKQYLYTPINSTTLENVQKLAPVILLATKSYDIPALLDNLAPRITDSTLLVSIQNGFAAYDAITSTFGPERAAMGVLYVTASTISPGVIDVKPNVAQFFLPQEHHKELQPIVDTLNDADVEAALVDDIERRMWIKQLFLVPFAIVNAQTCQPIGKIRENAETRDLWLTIAQEITAVTQACGIRVSDNAPNESLAKADRFDPQADSSFARDVWANKPHEAEALFGPLLHRAHEHHLSCPLLQQAYDYYVK